uniref:Uncharacterized protein n=1 Tax=viral metagenome TaxID=1070528 RepID=A0A6C0C1X1_9ZZZZ
MFAEQDKLARTSKEIMDDAGLTGIFSDFNPEVQKVIAKTIRDILTKELKDLTPEQQIQKVKEIYPPQTNNSGSRKRKRNGGRKKRTRRRRKSRRKSRRRKRTRKRRKSRRKSRRKRGSGSNFLNDILQEEKQIQKKYENPTPEDLFKLIYNIENDTDNLTPEERIQFRNGVIAQGSDVKKLIYLISTWQVFQKGRKNKIKFFQYNDFDDFMNVVRAHISENRDSQSGGRR